MTYPPFSVCFGCSVSISLSLSQVTHRPNISFLRFIHFYYYCCCCLLSLFQKLDGTTTCDACRIVTLIQCILQLLEQIVFGFFCRRRYCRFVVCCSCCRRTNFSITILWSSARKHRIHDSNVPFYRKYYISNTWCEWVCRFFLLLRSLFSSKHKWNTNTLFSGFCLANQRVNKSTREKERDRKNKTRMQIDWFELNSLRQLIR